MNSDQTLFNSSDCITAAEAEKAQEIFNKIWDSLVVKYGRKNMKFPRKIVALNGAPGSGKGTNITTVMRTLEIPSKPVVVSSLLDSKELRAIKDSGKLIDDFTVISCVIEALLQPSCEKGVILDGFPRTKVQAQFLKLFISKLRTTDQNRWCNVVLIDFYVSLEVSIERQLERGRQAIEHNKTAKVKIPVRETDINRELAKKRYATYDKETKQCARILKDFVESIKINTEGSLEEVRERVGRSLSK